jgi:P-type Cu2+ transporter
VIWLVFMNHEFALAIERAVTMMVITCPHALGLAVPLVVAVSTALAASNGLLIRNCGHQRATAEVEMTRLWTRL